MTTKRFVGCALIAGAIGLPVAELCSQSGSSRVSELERTVDGLEREVERLKAGAGATPPRRSSDYYTQVQEASSLDQGGERSALNERVKIGGHIDFEFYDAQAERRSLGKPFGNEFGNRNGATEFRVRRVHLNLGIEMIDDFVFHSTLILDPVVRDQDEGAVDIEEAYFKFGNVVRNLLSFEDPSNSYLRAGNIRRWESEFSKFRSESFSLAGTSFYRDEVTGFEMGGDFESGLFYRIALDNGYVLTARDAGAGSRNRKGGGTAVGAAPILHDNEQRGDGNNRKVFTVGVGFRTRLEDPAISYRLGLSYRTGRLSPDEIKDLSKELGTVFDGTSKKRRFGALGGLDFEGGTYDVGVDAEVWTADDGNGQREIFSIAPWVKLKLEGTYYQQRLFFTGVGFGYRISYMHQHEGITDPSSIADIIRADRTMHTAVLSLDVTDNVDLIAELNSFDVNGPNVSDTEWLIQWQVRF